MSKQSQRVVSNFDFSAPAARLGQMSAGASLTVLASVSDWPRCALDHSRELPTAITPRMVSSNLDAGSPWSQLEGCTSENPCRREAVARRSVDALHQRARLATPPAHKPQKHRSSPGRRAIRDSHEYQRRSFAAGNSVARRRRQIVESRTGPLGSPGDTFTSAHERYEHHNDRANFDDDCCAAGHLHRERFDKYHDSGHTGTFRGRHSVYSRSFGKQSVRSGVLVPGLPRDVRQSISAIRCDADGNRRFHGRISNVPGRRPRGSESWTRRRSGRGNVRTTGQSGNRSYRGNNQLVKKPT